MPQRSRVGVRSIPEIEKHEFIRYIVSRKILDRQIIRNFKFICHIFLNLFEIEYLCFILYSNSSFKGK